MCVFGEGMIGYIGCRIGSHEKDTLMLPKLRCYTIRIREDIGLQGEPWIGVCRVSVHIVLQCILHRRSELRLVSRKSRVRIRRVQFIHRYKGSTRTDISVFTVINRIAYRAPWKRRNWNSGCTYRNEPTSSFFISCVVLQFFPGPLSSGGTI
jgi:hypothetical protein